MLLQTGLFSNIASLIGLPDSFPCEKSGHETTSYSKIGPLTTHIWRYYIVAWLGKTCVTCGFSLPVFTTAYTQWLHTNSGFCSCTKDASLSLVSSPCMPCLGTSLVPSVTDNPVFPWCLHGECKVTTEAIT